MTSPFGSACLIAALLFVARPGAASGNGPTLDALLRHPLSPGAVTLLVDYSPDSRAQARLVEALSNPDPAIRAAAARVINVAAVATAVPDLAKVLRAEQSPAALLEEGRAAVWLDAPDAESLAIDAMRKLHNADEQALAEALAASLAMKKGPALAASVDALVSITHSPEVWRALTLGITRRGQLAIDTLSKGLLAAGDLGAWQGFLAALGETKATLPDESLVAALRSGTPDIPAVTCWYASLARTPGVNDTVRAAIPARDTSGVTAAPACDILLRLAEKGADREALLKEARELTVPESLSDVLRRSLPAPWPGVHSSAPQQFDRIGLASEFPPGVVADIATVAGCSWPKSFVMGGAVLTYGESGRARSAAIVNTPLSPACTAAMRALALTSIAPTRHVPRAGARELVLLRTDRDGMTCLAGQVWRAGFRLGTLVSAGKVKPPVKTKDVRPNYPAEAQQAGAQGTVVMESTIGPSGCVEAAEVIRSGGQLLDIAALEAVSRWQFTPTLLDSKAVPVIMTVTVQFTPP